MLTRRDLLPGYQAVQSAHAAVDFQHQHPKIAKEWNKNSNYLVILSVENEEQLLTFLEKFKSHGLKTTHFIEPDINNQLTAVAVEPSEITGKLCSSLPLAFKELTI